MNDDPEMTPARRAIVGALITLEKANVPVAEKANAEIGLQPRIHAALERMLGGPLPVEEFGLAAAMGTAPSIPTFDQIEVPESYKILKEKVSALDALCSSLRGALDELQKFYQQSWQNSQRLDSLFKVDPEHGFSIENAIILNGIFRSSEISIIYLVLAGENVLEALRATIRTHYPAGSGRKRNLREYLIAEKLARYYLKSRKQKPTYGTSDGYPSGDYMRALEEIFEILGIESGTRGPAKAACNGISEQDLKDAQRAFPVLGSLFGQGRL